MTSGRNKILQSKRFREIKTPQKSTGTKRFKSSVLAKRRQKFYTTGAGKTGLPLKHSRVMRHVRHVRDIQNKRINEMAGLDDKKKTVIYSGFGEVIMGAVDAYGRQVQKLATDFAKERRRMTGGTEKQGLKIRSKDYIMARDWIRRIARK